MEDYIVKFDGENMYYIIFNVICLVGVFYYSEI